MSEVLVKEKTDTLDVDTEVKYLNLYVGQADWQHHIAQLWGRLSSKQYSPEDRKAMMRKILSCAILLPSYDKTKVPEVPENLLYWVSSYTQFNERDWFSLLQDVIERDTEIEKWRNQSLSLGVVHPIEYSPVTRQAFNWLYSEADHAGVITPDNKQDMERRYKNLVLAYGGNVICSIFIKEKHRLKKVLNWRTGYFFERIIFETYTAEQVLKIKKAELSKTNQSLVKQLRSD